MRLTVLLGFSILLTASLCVTDVAETKSVSPFESSFSMTTFLVDGPMVFHDSADFECKPEQEIVIKSNGGEVTKFWPSSIRYYEIGGFAGTVWSHESDETYLASGSNNCISPSAPGAQLISFYADSFTISMSFSLEPTANFPPNSLPASYVLSEPGDSFMNDLLTPGSPLGTLSNAGTGYLCIDLLRHDLDNWFRVRSGIVNSIAFTKNSYFRFVEIPPNPSLTISIVSPGSFLKGNCDTTVLMKAVGWFQPGRCDKREFESWGEGRIEKTI